jgi:NIMA (never in mitosis gene a)-related kinase
MPNKDDHKSGASEPSGPGDKLSHYKIGDQVGKGAFGIVFKTLSNIDGKTYVMKNISVGHMSTEQQQHAMQEVDVLKRCDHPHIIKYYASFIQSKQLHIVMEYAECGDLQKLIDVHRRRNDHFSEERLWRFCKEMCSALTYLHSKNIIHRDLKPLNIFLDKDKSVKVGDLGVSKSCNEMDMTHSRVGTPLYLAPEQIKYTYLRFLIYFVQVLIKRFDKSITP